MGVNDKCRKVLAFLPGIVLLGLGIYLIVTAPQEKLISYIIGQEAELLKGRGLYEQVWSKLNIQFRVYLFDVLNADDIMDGVAPELEEHGPYVYDLNVKKNVLSIDEDTDEISYYKVQTFHFNKHLSVGSEDDDLTIINSAYIGTIATMAGQFPSFVKKIGNDIEKLYPGMDDLFIRAKAGDILFGGLPMVCDPKKFPELKLICGFLMGKKPPGIKNTAVEGVYAWSFFEKLNGTEQGPLSVNRGIKNKTRLGDTTSFKGNRAQKIWASKECNQVTGTDSITWPPMAEQLDFLTTFEPSICKQTKVYYLKDVVVSGLVGRKFQVKGEPWQPEEIECYCPVVKKQPVCLTTGIIDITKCQDIPIYYSEPHFLFGDDSLRQYAKGLNPDVDKHASYIIIEPLSGAPLSGSKKLQLNAKIIKIPSVTMLSNVTEGFFPILWAEESAESTVEMVADILQGYRLLRLLRYLVHVPLILGIFMIIKAAFLQIVSESDIRVLGFVPSHSVLIRNTMNRGPRRSITRRPRLRFDRGYD